MLSTSMALSAIAVAAGSGGKPRASLALDFLTPANFDPRITFTRADATTCATYFDSTGRLATAAANVARFDYDPATPLAYTSLLSVSGVSSGATSSGNFIPSLSTTATVSSGKRYLVSYTATALVGQLSGAVDLTAQGTAQSINWTGTFSEILTAATTGTVTVGLIARGSGVTSVTGSVSVQEISYSPRGLLIEESRTNMLLQSRDMTQAAWSKTDVTPTRNQVGIDGTANSACLITEGSAGTAQLSQNGAAVTAGSTITASAVFKRGNCDWVRIKVGESGGVNFANGWFNLSTGAKGALTAGGATTNTSSTITPLGGGAYRCTVSCTPDGVYTVPRMEIRSAASDNSGVLANATYIVDCAQLEVGAFATSIITTTASTVTRAADSASMTGTNFSSWYNQTAGTFVAEFRRFGFDGGAGAVGICQADDGTTNNRVALRLGTRQTTSQAQQTIAVASVVNLNEGLGPLTSIDGLNVKATIGYQIGVGATGRDGTVVNATSNPSLPTVTQFSIGQGSGAVALNGHIRRITYYPTRLSNAQLQALTT